MRVVGVGCPHAAVRVAGIDRAGDPVLMMCFGGVAVCRGGA